jgi:hypothetical protein
VYDSKNAVALPTKLKFQLALRTSIDPVSITGAAFMSGIKQAADTPDYVQGAKGYGQRFGAEYTDAFTDILFGGAILPSLFHQDPRYFYQGSGTIKSLCCMRCRIPSSPEGTVAICSQIFQVSEAI